MLADFFTKPLNGALFQRFKAVIMGHAHISTLLSSSKERVENLEPQEKCSDQIDVHNNVDITADINSQNTDVLKGRRSYLQVLTGNAIRNKAVSWGSKAE